MTASDWWYIGAITIASIWAISNAAFVLTTGRRLDGLESRLHVIEGILGARHLLPRDPANVQELRSGTERLTIINGIDAGD